MGWRYRKSINLGGGFRVNLSKSGIGYSWGVKGYRITKTADGRTRHTASIPGTGISYVEEHGRSGPAQGAPGRRQILSPNTPASSTSFPPAQTLSARRSTTSFSPRSSTSSSSARCWPSWRSSPSPPWSSASPALSRCSSFSPRAAAPSSTSSRTTRQGGGERISSAWRAVGRQPVLAGDHPDSPEQKHQALGRHQKRHRHREDDGGWASSPGI